MQNAKSKRCFVRCCVTATLLAANACWGQTLSQLLNLARANEPTYLGAKSSLQASHARTHQAFGAMLPQLTASGATNANNRDYQTRGIAAPSAKDSYNSNSAQISLTQPIWRYANVVGWQQAQAVAAQAQMQLKNVEQELFSKLVSAWFDVLAARDSLRFTDAQLLATERQLEVFSRGVDIGLFGQPQAEEARMKLGQARADKTMAEVELRLKLGALEHVSGSLPGFVPPTMIHNAELVDLGRENLEKWLSQVEERNPGILAARQAFDAAESEVRKQQAGHLPTLDLVASYGKNSQAVGGFPGQAGYDILQGSIGLQLSIPLFSGGTQSAKVDEALAQKEKARLEIEAARRGAVLAIRQAWFSWQAAHARTSSGLLSLRSAETAIKVARTGATMGTKTQLDELLAEQQWHAAQRDFRKGRYDQVAAFVKIKAQVGALTFEDVAALDSLFTEAREAIGPRTVQR